MNNYAEMLAEDRRLVILRLLESSGGYRANEYLLQTALPSFGHDVSQDRLRADLAWLAEQSLVQLDDQSGVQVATATQRGVDVALGHARVPGVKRPRPEA